MRRSASSVGSMRSSPALGRPLDTTYPSNRFVLVATPVLGAIAGVIALINGESLATAVTWGVSSGGAGFLAWAVARELHPDRVWVATAATLIAPLGLMLARPDLWGSAVVLLVGRAVAGTVGREMRTADVVLFSVVGAMAATRPAGAAHLGVGAVGLVLTAIWSERHRTEAAVTAALYAVAAVGISFFSEVATPSDEGWIVFGVGAALGLITLAGPARVAAGTDRPGGVIQAKRVRMARLIALLAAGVASVTVDPAVVFPTWAVLAVVALRPR